MHLLWCHSISELYGGGRGIRWGIDFATNLSNVGNEERPHAWTTTAKSTTWGLAATVALLLISHHADAEDRADLAVSRGDRDLQLRENNHRERAASVQQQHTMQVVATTAKVRPQTRTATMRLCGLHCMCLGM